MSSKLPIFVALFSISVLLSPHTYAQETTTSSVTPTASVGATTPTPTRASSLILKPGTLQEQKTKIEAALKIQRDLAMARNKIKRDQFKIRIETIKDSQKKLVVERIDAKISTINQNRTGFLSSILERLTSILARISEKADAAKTQGKDTTKVLAAITAAQAAINKAQTAVTAQSQKDYIVIIGTDTTLRADVGATMKQFETDLRATQILVIDAKQAVVSAGTEIIKLRGDATASASASVAPAPIESGPAGTSVITPTPVQAGSAGGIQ